MSNTFITKKRNIFLRSLVWSSFFWLPLVCLIYMNCMNESPDYKAHMAFVYGKTFSEIVSSGLPHLLVHYLLQQSSLLLGVKLEWTFFIYTAISIIALFVIKIRLGNYLNPNLNEKQLGLIVGCSSVMGAIYLKILNPFHYLGIWSPLAYHNPTTIWLKPFAALIVFLILKNHLYKDSNPRKEYLISFILAAATLVKPNFTIVIIPAFFILSIMEKDFRKFFRLCLPATAILVLQFLITFTSASPSKSKVIFTLAKPWSVYSNHIFFAIFQNLLGPVLITIYLYKNKKLKMDAKFLWLLTLISLCQGLFMAESGPRFEGMNFIWGYVVIVEIIFFYLINQFFKEASRPTLFRKITFTVILWHFCSGLYFVIGNLRGWNPLGF